MAKKRRLRKSLRTLLLTLSMAMALLICVTLITIHLSNNQSDNTKIASSSSFKTDQTGSAASTAITNGCEDEVISSSYTDTDSLLLLANKKHKLPEGYTPADLVYVQIPCYNGSALMRSEASEALTKMYTAALDDGVSLSVSSCFRDENYQSDLYDKYVNLYGSATADTISSRPSYSDHQTGLAGDFVEGSDADFNEEFENTASGKWLAANAHIYGFIMRYPKNKEAVTGYEYEPWHFRYIGVQNATLLYNEDPNESFEEYYNVSGGDYCDS